MSKNNIIEFENEINKLNELIKDQAKLFEAVGVQIKKSYVGLPSELLKQLKEQNNLEIQVEKKRQESLKTLERVEVLRTRELATNKKAQEVAIQSRRENERAEAVEARKALAIERATRKVIEQNSAYIKLQNSWKSAQRALADSIVTDGLKAKSTKALQVEFDVLDRKIKSVDAATKNYSKNVGNYSSAFGGLTSLGSQLAGALGLTSAIAMTVQLGKSIYTTTKELQTLYMSMELGSKDSESYANNLRFLDKITEDYGLELTSATRAYNKFYVASKNKLALEDIQLIFDKVSKSASIMGMSVYDQEGIFKALEQMMSKGTVQAEELRMQLGDRLPGSFEIMAKAVGVSTAELGEMMKRGEVIASDVLPKFAIELEKSFGANAVDKVETLTAAENRLTNSFTNFVKEVNSGSGILSKTIMKLYDQITITIVAWTKLMSTSGTGNIDTFGESIDRVSVKIGDRIKKTSEDSKNVARSFYQQNLLMQSKYEKDLDKIITKGASGKLGKQASARNAEEMERLQKMLKNIQTENEALSQIMDKGLSSEQKIISDPLKTDDKGKKERERAEEERRKDIAENNRLRISWEIEQNRNILLLEAKNDSEKLAIQLKYNEDSKRLLEFNYNEEVRLAKGNQEKLTLALTKFNQEKEKLAFESEKITKEAADKQLEQAFELANLIESNELKNEMRSQLSLAKSNQSKVQIRLKYLDDQKTILDRNEQEDIASGKHTTEQLLKLQEEYNQKRADLENEGREILKSEADKTAEMLRSYLEQFTDLSNFGFGSLNLFTKLDKDGKTAFENLLDSTATWGEKSAIIFNSVGEVFKDAMGAMQQSSKIRFDNEMQQLKTSYEISLLFAGDSAAAKEKLDQDLEEKQKALRIKQAKRDKQMAIMNAVINTAQGVVSMLASVPWPANLVMAGVVGALGAVQIATIASTPIPEFWTGTDNAPQGWALTQERGAEVITDKKGNVKTMGNNKGAQLTFLESGDKVFKSQEDYFKSDLANTLNNSGISHNINVDPFDYNRFDSILAKNTSSTNVNMVFDEDGFNYRTDKRNVRQRNKNYNARG